MLYHCSGAFKIWVSASCSLELPQLRHHAAQASKMHIKGDPAVSERHGVIAWAADGWTLTDAGSSNGTLVNGERLEANGGQPHPSSGDANVLSCNPHLCFEKHLKAYGECGCGYERKQLLYAGPAKQLKDGDIMQFGTDTKVRIEARRTTALLTWS